MQNKPNNTLIAAGLFFAVFVWGANNAAAKFILKSWPANFTGSTRFLAAGLILLALLRWTKLFGATHAVPPDLNRRLWWRGGLSLAVYIVVFNWALKLTALSHVALYLGASPVWALLWEGRPERSWKSAQRYGAAALAFCGVLILLWPALRTSSGSLLGELLGFACSLLWTNFGNQCRVLGRDLNGAEVSAHTFWRAGLILAPFAAGELFTQDVPVRSSLILAQMVCVLGGSVVAFAIWNSALRHWQTSRVYLFNNLIPLSTTAWAYFCLGEQLTSTFWPAMILIGAGVFLGQANWEKFFGRLWLPTE
ncbi:MAG: DMT family transporter [Verrucomicrobiota bacterium]